MQRIGHRADGTGLLAYQTSNPAPVLVARTLDPAGGGTLGAEEELVPLLNTGLIQGMDLAVDPTGGATLVWTAPRSLSRFEGVFHAAHLTPR